tara:strand:+ start:1950 stop:3767 length:1818 start_codon:yes stop_codon:yes gene_type:complete
MPIERKYLPIEYTSRDYDSIRSDLLSYATRYYSDSFKDFSKASFASLMIDTVSYVGDIMSFYLDYQVNEMYLDTATEFRNVSRIGRQMGYKYSGSPVSQGIVDFYALIPASSDGLTPDPLYMPILKRGTKVSSTGGVQFTLVEDVDFSSPVANYVVARLEDAAAGGVNAIAVRVPGRVASGAESIVNVSVGAFRRFQRVSIPESNISEIISVVDSEGHEYFQVDYLSQNVIYRAIPNTGEGKDRVPNILVPQIVPRRFIVEQTRTNTVLVFGYGSEDELKTNIIDDPKNVAINFYGKDYITDKSFDPTRIIETDKFGVAPVNTSLQITYRHNNAGLVNAEAATVTSVKEFILEFPYEERDIAVLDSGVKVFIEDSLEVNNPQSIVGDVNMPTIEEMKIRIMDTFASQNRAVTKSDYRAVIYNMPATFGAVKKCNVVQNYDSNRRTVNAYILSENTDGTLTTSNVSLKSNLKTWLSKYKMINDAVDIMDGKIVNLGVDFIVVSEHAHNKYEILQACTNALISKLGSKTMEMGEPFYVTKVYDILRRVEGVLDVAHVKVNQVTGTGYSQTVFDINEQTSPDGRYIVAPLNVVFELKNFYQNVKGTVR